MEPTDEYRIWTPTSPLKAFKAQQDLLGVLFKYTSKFVDIGDAYINTIKLGSGDKNLVMTHGYGAGLGFFYKNYPSLSNLDGFSVYSFDWQGMGSSSRPAFVKTRRNQSEDELVGEAEDFFVDSLEKWRAVQGLEKMVLMGHSLGGYLSTCYSLKYPERVEKLILVSPAGIPISPREDKEKIKNQSWLITIARSLWSWNITPMLLIRTLGPIGPRLVNTYTSRRFADLDAVERKNLDNYIYHISAQPGSGEYALARLLLPGAYARRPLFDRLPRLAIPVSFIYGRQDWMDHRNAVNLGPNMKCPTTVAVVDQADNADAFNHALVRELGLKDLDHPDVTYPYTNF